MARTEQGNLSPTREEVDTAMSRSDSAISNSWPTASPCNMVALRDRYRCIRPIGEARAVAGGEAASPAAIRIVAGSSHAAMIEACSCLMTPLGTIKTRRWWAKINRAR
jgi:hypothetical protein